MPGIRIEVLQNVIETYDHKSRVFLEFKDPAHALATVKKYIIRDMETLKAEDYSKPFDQKGVK